MFYVKFKKKWFTLVEVIIVCTLFAMFVIWIILWINRAFSFMNDTRLRVISSNLAREWVEMMYNIRDTNRRKYSWEKDKHWLERGSDTQQFTNLIYSIGTNQEEGEPYCATFGSRGNANMDCYETENFFGSTCDAVRNSSKITFTWTYKYYSGWNMETWNISDLLEWGLAEFYRLVRVDGVYQKNVEDINTITDGNDWTPAEMRFCVKVFYVANWWKHSTELCSIMTNFME